MDYPGPLGVVREAESAIIVILFLIKATKMLIKIHYTKSLSLKSMETCLRKALYMNLFFYEDLIVIFVMDHFCWIEDTTELDCTAIASYLYICIPYHFLMH